MPLYGAGVDGVALGINAGGDHVGALVHIREEKSGADAGLGMEAGAAVSMPTSSDLEVEGAVHTVLLCPKYRSQMLRHYTIL